MDLAITYKCPTDNGQRTVDLADIYIYTEDSECDLCGSHGSVEVDISCSCGKSHRQIIKDW